MLKYYDILRKSRLFESISSNEIGELLKCLNATIKKYVKGSYIINYEDKITTIGIMLSGLAQIIKEDEFGEKIIVSELASGDLFGETFCCAGIDSSPVTVFAVQDTQVMFIDFQKIITTCSSSCVFHTFLIQNMLKLLANKNLFLNEKISILSKKTIREKLMSYFVLQSQKNGKNEFFIPFKREELADFLSVNRSAVSRELSNMRDEGIIEFNKNWFKILD